MAENPFAPPMAELDVDDRFSEAGTDPDVRIGGTKKIDVPELPKLTKEMHDDVHYILAEFGSFIARSGVDIAEDRMEEFFDTHMRTLPDDRHTPDGLTGEHDLFALAAKQEFVRLATQKIQEIRDEEFETKDTVDLELP